MRRSGQFFSGACALGAVFLPGTSFGQEGGPLLTFGFENRFEISRNADLAVPAEGTDLANVTQLTFGIQSETPLDQLEFEVTGAIIAQNTDDGSEIDFGRSALTFGYTREVPTAALALSAEFRTDDVGAFGDDLGSVDETGTRSDLFLSAGLEIGRTSGVGLAFGLAYDQTEFSDVTDPDLIDSQEWRGDVAAILRFSEVATGRVGVRYRHREEEDAATTTINETTIFTGLDYALSERTDLALELGHTRTETEEFDVIETERGPDALIRLSYDMPVGVAYTLLSVTTGAEEGQRETFEIGRALETDRDSISARLGVTRNDETGTDIIGAIDWTRALPDGSIGVSLERSVGYDEDDDTEVTASDFSMIWTKNISDVSTILLDLSYERRDSTTENIEQVSIDAGYNYLLTADWSLSSGVGYTVRDDADGRAKSPRLFVGLSRDFQIRP